MILGRMFFLSITFLKGKKNTLDVSVTVLLGNKKEVQV